MDIQANKEKLQVVAGKFHKGVDDTTGSMGRPSPSTASVEASLCSSYNPSSPLSPVTMLDHSPEETCHNGSIFPDQCPVKLDDHFQSQGTSPMISNVRSALSNTPQSSLNAMTFGSVARMSTQMATSRSPSSTGAARPRPLTQSRRFAEIENGVWLPRESGVTDNVDILNMSRQFIPSEADGAPLLHLGHPGANAIMCYSQQELRTVPLDRLERFNAQVVSANTAEVFDQSVWQDPQPHKSGDSCYVSSMAAANWYGMIRSLDLVVPFKGPEVIGAPFKIPRLVRNASRKNGAIEKNHLFLPRLPLTQQLQVSMVDAILRLPLPGLQVFPVAPDQPIHIFVDVSNILVSWLAYLKMQHNMQATQHCKSLFSFPVLHRILARGRPLGPCLAAGSLAPTDPNRVFVEAETVCGYDVAILPRIPVNSYEMSAKSRQRVREHFADETLQGAMGRSLLDTLTPSTMVVATGDGNVADYSDGFLQWVERALRQGWNVELVAFSPSVNHAYFDRGFLSKWYRQFTMIQLDPFAELLHSAWLSH